MHRFQASAKLIDSQQHGAGCELFLVEGDSAAGAVAAVRDARTQAVLPLQGKPLNAWRASPARVAAYPLYPQLAGALGLPSPTDSAAADGSALRFERLLLLLDPDADGVHIGALMLLYLKRFAPALLAQERVWMVRAPAAGLRVAARDSGETEDVWVDTPEQARALRERAAAQAEHWLVLRATCVDPATRRADAVTPAQLQAVIHRFDGGPVGLDNIAASIGEEAGTIEDVIEPYLIQQGYLQRTPRGRVATLAAYRHLGVAAPQGAGGLFGG